MSKYCRKNLKVYKSQEKKKIRNFRYDNIIISNFIILIYFLNFDKIKYVYKSGILYVCTMLIQYSTR